MSQNGIIRRTITELLLFVQSANLHQKVDIFDFVVILIVKKMKF